ncbi:MAG: HAD-IC family P-type ATPase, partial [Clostridia bacterium]|nr:HAD-IC family P-type ATPase [Clostridia bacterium]
SAISQRTGEEKLPLQNLLKDSGKIINIVIISLCVLVFIISLIQNFNTDHFASMTIKMLINSVALAVAAIPEGLPAIATIVIGIGIQRIISNNILIKNTNALEVLGKTSVLCADKTGLLTKNSMLLEKIFDGKQLITLSEDKLSESAALVIKLATISSTLDNDPTETAIEKACIEYNSMSKIDTENIYPRLCDIPFDAERKTMTTINMINERPIAISKGAPEILVTKCKNCNVEEILKYNEELASEELRIVCIAIKPLDAIPANPSPDDIENDMTFVGLIGLIDPPRSEAFEAVNICDKAGIKTVMITGDNPTTARAIARRIGILKDGTDIITGAELADFSDSELNENIEKYSVFARVSPNDKLRIVKAWQSKGKTVTITGDSVADSDALSIADIGCAMGKSGTDIAKGSADIIAVNDRFLSIVGAIKESRGLFENIRKSVIYLLSCNFAEVLLYILGLLIIGVPPLAAVQLLWINLLTDCAPAISLSMEKAEDRVMRHKPIALKGHLFDKKTVISIAIQTVLIAL